MPKLTTNTSRKLVRNSVIIAIISLALLEAIAVVYHYVNTSEWFYTRQTPTTRETPAATPTPQSKLVMHPYLGFIRRPGTAVSQVLAGPRLQQFIPDSDGAPQWLSLQSNNTGFFSTSDYPTPRTDPDDYLIAIFGGSVGQWFALQGSEKLRTLLNKAPEFSGRNIRILNFAQGGFKQPQQLLALSYFLAQGQSLDFVLNIDGFNELALGQINEQRDIDASMPSAQHMIPLLKLIDSQNTSAEDLSRTFSIVKKRQQLARLERRLSETSSAALHLVLTQIQALLQNQLSVLQYQAQESRSDADSSLYQLTARGGKSATRVFPVWGEAARMMQDLSVANGIDYLELVQPNQYAGNKPLSSAERDVAIRESSPFRTAVEKYYPRLPAWLRTQQAQGLNIQSATAIFDEIQEPVYADDCCHYNQYGNEILAEFAARSILNTLRSKTPE